MKLEVISPKKILYTGEVDLVQLPGKMGSFEILQNHAPLVAILEKGRLKIIDTDRNTHFIPLNGGMVKVRRNTITVLTEVAE
ncbi:MAG: ATP synthase F1 subunit epsilon [Bacteroidales bacterium]